jgi:hypothetical protein
VKNQDFKLVTLAYVALRSSSNERDVPWTPLILPYIQTSAAEKKTFFFVNLHWQKRHISNLVKKCYEFTCKN